MYVNVMVKILRTSVSKLQFNTLNISDNVRTEHHCLWKNFLAELLNGITIDRFPKEILLQDKYTEEKATQEISFYLIIGMMQKIIWTSSHSHVFVSLGFFRTISLVGSVLTQGRQSGTYRGRRADKRRLTENNNGWTGRRRWSNRERMKEGEEEDDRGKGRKEVQVLRRQI